jgi:peptide/nickel transport system substrate-binding protein
MKVLIGSASHMSPFLTIFSLGSLIRGKGSFKTAALILFILVHVALWGCDREDRENTVRRSSDTGPAYGDIMVEGSIGDASNLIPILSSDSTSHQIASMVFNGLVKYDKDLNIVGDLAESWEMD